MAKIRAGSNKKPVDFKRKVVKVGRKIKKNNVTTITVQSKRIQIPLQTQISGRRLEDEKDRLNYITRQLSHFSGPTRKAAIDDLKQFLSDSPNAESYIAMIVPASMELLYDEERDTRRALLSMFAWLMGRFPARSFESISSLIVTYLCSGLTSLLKVVEPFKTFEHL